MNFRLVLILILCLFIGVSFATLPRNPLQNDDASLYALAAKNAVIHNQWLVQFVTPGDPASFLDKPPLGLWLLAWPMKLLGVSELTVHLPNVIYFTLLLAIMYFSLAKLASRKLALYSTLIAATSLCLVVYSRAPKLDVLLTLFVLTANLSLYAFLKKNDPSYLIPLTLSLACGCLTKSGFGLLFPALTILFLLLFNPQARKKLLKLLSTIYFPLAASLFLLTIGLVLWGQSFALKDQFLPYLRSMTIQSKYNTSYMGLGFYYSIAGFLLITLFPWSPLWLTSIKLNLFRNLRLKSRFQVGSEARINSRFTNFGTANLFVGSRLNLNTFCSLWFWSNVLFLLFFYRQNDLRTFTVFVPPLAILAGLRLISLGRKPAPVNRGGFLTLWKPRRLVSGFQLFFFLLFLIILIAVIRNPVNPDGFSLSAAILPLALFVISLLLFLKPSPRAFAPAFAFTIIAYSVLFYNTKPLADAFNPDVKWPAIIKEQQAKGVKFFIYRPPDRQLFFSPDLFYVDFMAGPADRYFWDKNELLSGLRSGPAIVLSDTKSWEKLGYTGSYKSLAQDSYSSLIQVRSSAAGKPDRGI